MKSLIWTALTALFVSNLGLGADWPQWRGPNRDGVSPQTGLLKSWPQSGPKLLWTSTEAGIGYGGPAIVGTTLYLMGSDDDADGEFVLAIDITNGKQKWRSPTKTAKRFPRFNSDWGGGPRSTPTVVGDRLFVIGVHGDLSCLETGSGKIVWHKSLQADLGGKAMGLWGYCESPLFDGDLVICSPGYDDKNGQGGVAALDAKSGSVKWQSKELTDQASYASLVVSEGGGVRQYVGLTNKGGFGIRTSDGMLLWKSKLGGNRVAVIPTPIVQGDLVHLNSDYEGECGTVRLAKTNDGVKAEQLFSDGKIKNHHGGVIFYDGAVFFTSGNANQKPTLPFVCLDMESGKVLWQVDSSLEPSSIVFAEGHFYCYGQKTGTVVRVAASKSGYQESGRFTIPKTSDQMKPQGGIWTHPVIADGKLFLRDQELLFCYDLKETTTE